MSAFDRTDMVRHFNSWEPPMGTMPPDLKDRVAALERHLPDVPPVFHHLFAMLPAPGSEFPAQDRTAFLRAAAALADVVYGAAPPISIEVASPPPQEAERT